MPLEAIHELEHEFGVHDNPRGTLDSSESRVQSLVRLEAAAKGWDLWRNNVGAFPDEIGRVVRYGLANDSKKLNEQFKSGDLIGIRPVVITPHMIGHTIGQFASIEVKEGNWQYSGTPREDAQLKWAKIVVAAGGWAKFINKTGEIE